MGARREEPRTNLHSDADEDVSNLFTEEMRRATTSPS